jgi:hypothetical protein
MKRKLLAIGISTISVILLILASLTNVIGYQTVQTTQQNVIKERINKKELLFQTIFDITNNKEIQRVILKSQMSRGIFPNPDVKFSLTKNQLSQMYIIGLILSKFLSKSSMQSIVGKYQFDNQGIQKEISAVIEKDATIQGEITQLQNSECNCEKSINEEKESIIDSTDYPMICEFLYNVYFASTRVYNHPIIGFLLWLTMFPFMLSMLMISIITFTLYAIFDCIQGPSKDAFYTD